MENFAVFTNFITGNLFPLLAFAGIAFYVATYLGGNDVANSMGTSVGSKALTLRQAIIIAGILEFTGAVLFGQRVSQTLATGVVKTELFASTPLLFLLGMVSVLLAGGVWLQIATRRGLPVSSSHAIVGALAGFSALGAGFTAVRWQTLTLITLSWMITPLVSGLIAFLFFTLLKILVLDRPNPIQSIQFWSVGLSLTVISIFSVIIFPALRSPISLIFDQFSWEVSPIYGVLTLSSMASLGLVFMSWNILKNGAISSLENQSNSPQVVENLLGKFQIVSACFVAFAHGSNDVGNAIAPLAAIVYIYDTGSVPLDDFPIPLWVLILGGLGIVVGLSIFGKNVISTVGEGIIELQPSRGFCAELATAMTVLIASRIGLPVSTSHALVGAVIGVGLVSGLKSVRFETVKPIILAWVITIPFAILLSALIFGGLRLVFTP